jgi:hypothetical protein
MRLLRLISMFALFFGFIIVMALVFSQSDKSQAKESNAILRAQPAKEQESVLLIVVDRLEQQAPRLRSVWLAVSIPPRLNLTLAPVYPASFNSLADSLIDSAFGLTNANVPSTAFFDQLARLDVKAKQYLVVDEVALAEMTRLVEGVTIDGQFYGAQNILSGEYFQVNDRQQALALQTGLIKDLCQKIPLMTIHPDFPQALKTWQSHTSTSLDFDRIEEFWKSPEDPSHRITCEFPSLAQQTQNQVAQKP